MATILIVEDDIWLADCYKKWLVGYKTVHVANAQAALDALDDHRPHLVILDLLLPAANGIQLLNELRSHTDVAHIPIIICSNSALPSGLDLKSYGVKAAYEKSQLRPKQLRAAINEVLKNANLAD